MNLSLRQKLYGLTGAGLLVALLVGLSSEWSVKLISKATDQINLENRVLRNHTDADMMHDALRGDVLAALLAESSQDHAAVQDALRNHAQLFRDSIAENKKLAPSKEIAVALSAVENSLNDYMREAEGMCALAREDKARARARLSSFISSFKDLEGRMSRVSDLIEASSKACEENGKRILEASQRRIALIGLFSALLLGAFAYRLTRRMVQSLHQAAHAVEGLAVGDFTRSLTITSQDEIGHMSASLQKALARIKETLQADHVQWDELADSRRRAEELAQREREQTADLRTKVDQLLAVVDAAANGDLTRTITVQGDDSIGRLAQGLDRFFGVLRQALVSIGGNAQALAAASEELSSVSQQMSRNAEETSHLSNGVSAGAEEVSKNLQTVATGSEEMTASIKEIAKNAVEAAKVATSAVRLADTTNSSISKLGDSSAEIGSVMKVIRSIAQQTNLLALNATIEAARAGEAGKGFAVVANEVKELAKETAKATEDISHRIEAIQEDSKASVEAIQKISQVINQINDISSTIASAVEEQTATTNEISRNVSEAAAGGSEIARNIVGVAGAAQETSRGATDSQKAASELARMANELERLVNQFRIHEKGVQTPQVQFKAA